MKVIEKDNQVYTLDETSELYQQLIEQGFTVREEPKPKPKKKVEGAK